MSLADRPKAAIFHYVLGKSLIGRDIICMRFAKRLQDDITYDVFEKPLFGRRNMHVLDNRK